MSVAQSLAVAVALIACLFDLRSRRIPNVLTFGAAVAAFLFAAIVGGASALGMSLLALALATALWLPLYALGGMGAGDVKLMAAVAAWLGPWTALWAILYSAVAGAIMAAGVVIAHRSFVQTSQNIQLLLTHWRVMGFAPHSQLSLASSSGPRLAYAVPILFGTMAAVWLR